MKIQFLTSDIAKSMGSKNLKNSELSRISFRTFSESFKKIHFLTSRFDRKSAIYIYIYIFSAGGEAVRGC